MSKNDGLVLKVAGKVAKQVLEGAVNGGVKGIFTLDKSHGEGLIAIVVDTRYKQPGMEAGKAIPGRRDGKVYDRSQGARIRRGAGNFATGANLGDVTVKLDVKHNDKIGVTVAAVEDSGDADLW